MGLEGYHLENLYAFPLGGNPPDVRAAPGVFHKPMAWGKLSLLEGHPLPEEEGLVKERFA